MKSSTGRHYIALDHVRALATFMVFAWHFNHAANGYPVPFNFSPNVFPLALIDEGHTGVALFMTLSGYLFAALLDGKNIKFAQFFMNRVLRLLPLLILVIVIVGLMYVENREGLLLYLESILQGFILPTLPNGGWSITIEFHFYFMLPLLLWLFRKNILLPIGVIAALVVSRFFIWQYYDEVQSIAYFTIIGRGDQFLWGMVAFRFRKWFYKKHALVLLCLTCFSLYYFFFDTLGGFYNYPSYPSPSIIWVFMPSVEGLAYGILIAWYSESFMHTSPGLLSKGIAKYGEYSYSIYLFQFFIVFEVAKYINTNVMNISNFYISTIWALIFYFLMFPIGYLSFKLVEEPFLRLRKNYTQ
jgi:peptidoglycan/LPS O-acetylase OafA/YrhL